MKPFYLFLLVFSITIVFSCKKDRPGEGPVSEKKVVVTTVAGEGTPAFADGPLFTAKFRYPQDVAVSKNGTIFVSDALNYGIRKIAAGQVSTIADSYTLPHAVTVDANSNVYFTEIYDARVRKLAAGTYINSHVGTAQPGFADGVADVARFQFNNSIVADDAGNIYVADAGNFRIRKISVSGNVTTIAGSGEAGYEDGEGTTARFDSVGGITIDKLGNLYVIDRGNFRIRKITTDGKVSTIAGSGEQGNTEGKADEARFGRLMRDIVVNDKGTVYLLDEHRVRQITTQGIVSTIAGSTEGYIDGEGASAKFNFPAGLGIDTQGNIFVADQVNNRIRKISFE